MKAGYFARTLVAGGWLASLGQQSALAYSPLETAVRNAQRVEAPNIDESAENIFYRALAGLRKEEKERKNSFKTSRELYQNLGFLVYDDLAKLTAKFGMKLEPEELLAIPMGENAQTDKIIVRYFKNNAGEPETVKISFYPSNAAVVETRTLIDYFKYKTERKRLRLSLRGGIESVYLQDSALYSENFSYIIDMQKYDFQKVFRNLSGLLLERKSLGNSATEEDKIGEVRSQIKLIATGLFEKYGGVPNDWINEYNIIARNGVITLCADYPSWIGGMLWLKIGNGGEAELTLQRETDFTFGWRIKNFKIKPGDSIREIVTNVE